MYRPVAAASIANLVPGLVAVLLLGGCGLAMAAHDGQSRANELLGADPQYRETWQSVVKKEERLPEWVLNLSGTAEQMNAVEEDGDKYLVGPLCETADTCLNKRLIVAFSLDKEDAYAMLVEVPAGLPADKCFCARSSTSTMRPSRRPRRSVPASRTMT